MEFEAKGWQTFMKESSTLTTTSSSAGSSKKGPQMSKLNLENVKQWLPSAKGCKIWCETSTSRIRAAYMISGALVTRSMAIKAAGQEAAISWCLGWAWEQHTKATGEECWFKVQEL
eukprot:9352101-Lingulodinium_polyedra.AAC.1